MSNDSSKAWKDRQVRKGHCPHCGVFCAPWYECERRRNLKNIYRFFNRAAKAGILKKEWCGPGHAAKWSFIGEPSNLRANASGRDDDKRSLPRKNGRPMDVVQEAVRILTKAGRPLTEREIALRIGEETSSLDERDGVE